LLEIDVLLLTTLGATLDEEEVGWDEDDDSDAEKPPTNNPKSAAAVAATAASTETLIPKEEHLKPKSSIDRTSQPDSESSYDVVSGAASKTPSQAASSPPATKVASHFSNIIRRHTLTSFSAKGSKSQWGHSGYRGR